MKGSIFSYKKELNKKELKLKMKRSKYFVN